MMRGVLYAVVMMVFGGLMSSVSASFLRQCGEQYLDRFMNLERHGYGLSTGSELSDGGEKKEDYRGLTGDALRADIQTHILYPSYYAYLNRLSDEILEEQLFRLPTTERVIALTFDDGPVSMTRPLLAFLEERGVPATFFVVCNQLTEENVTRYENELFSVQPHSHRHANLDKLSEQQLEKDFASCAETFAILGLEPTHFRPPFGTINELSHVQVRKQGWQSVIWDVDSMDWDDTKAGGIVSRVVDNVQTGSIVLFHDGVDLVQLGEIIDQLEEKGYGFVRME